MKTLSTKKLNLLLLLFLIGTYFAVCQNDIILKINGEEMIGKVTEINSDDLKFIYQNETVNYTILKKEIVKITFASGRVEFFNKLNTQKDSEINLESHHNKVAILPFAFIKNQGDNTGESMSQNIQQETYTIFNKKKVNLQFQDPNTTNTLLIKAGINNSNRKGYTMGEICNILGVEYLIQGTVSIEKTNTMNVVSTNSQTKSKQKGDPYVDSHGHIIGDIWGNNSKKKTSSTTIGTNIQNYSTSIMMNIYNDRGENIFNQNHDSFWQTQDAYKITLSFLAKKTPIYKK